MKKISLICLFILLSITDFLIAKIDFPFVGIISMDKVNVRAGSNQNFEVLLKLNKGNKVVVVEERFSWYKIKLTNKDTISCFVNEKYLENIDGKIGKVIANHVNLRAKPQINSTILSQTNTGQILKIISKQKDWYEIIPTDECFGWVHRDFVKYSSAILGEVSNSSDSFKIKNTTNVKENDRLKEVNPLAIGIINDVGKTIGRVGTHKLIQENGEIFYLKGDIGVLNSFIYRKVKIYGKVNYVKHQKYPVIIVERVELVR